MITTKSNIAVTLALPTFTQSKSFLFDAINQKSKAYKVLNSASEYMGEIGEAMLFNLLSPKSVTKPPYAALSAIGNGLKGEEGSWLRIDPIELLVDAGNICLVGRDHLFLEELETQQITATLNDLLIEDNLCIKIGAAHEWFLQITQPPQISTYPIYDVMAKDIRDFLPQGSQQQWWRKLLTELQMLLFQHPANEIRRSLGKPLIHSVWPWGEGEVSNLLSINPYSTVWSDDSLIKGMLVLSDPALTLKSAYSFSSNLIEGPGNYLVTLNHYDYGLQRLQILIADLLEKIYYRKIHSLTIYLGNGSVYTWHAPRVRFFSFR